MGKKGNIHTIKSHIRLPCKHLDKGTDQLKIDCQTGNENITNILFFIRTQKGGRK